MSLGEVLKRFKRVLVPELNNGQLVRILRDRYLKPFIAFNKIKGMPFKAAEIDAKVDELVAAPVAQA